MIEYNLEHKGQQQKVDRKKKRRQAKYHGNKKSTDLSFIKMSPNNTEKTDQLKHKYLIVSEVAANIFLKKIEISIVGILII